MKPTQILSNEHQNILKVINAINKECDTLDTGKELDKSFFEKAIDFIRNYADRFHHAKEEDILFVELNKDTIQMHCGPVQQMLLEHDMGRDYVKGLEEGLEKNDKVKIIENARGYAQLLQQHIYKEDNILYPMADDALTLEVQQMMMEKFKQVEEEDYGRETIEKYLSIVEEFEKRSMGIG